MTGLYISEIKGTFYSKKKNQALRVGLVGKYFSMEKKINAYLNTKYIWMKPQNSSLRNVAALSHGNCRSGSSCSRFPPGVGFPGWTISPIMHDGLPSWKGEALHHGSSGLWCTIKCNPARKPAHREKWGCKTMKLQLP